MGKFTRDMKKPEFIAKYQKKYDRVFDIAKSPVKVTPAKPDPSNQTNENHDDSMVQSMFLVSPLKWQDFKVWVWCYGKAMNYVNSAGEFW